MGFYSSYDKKIDAIDRNCKSLSSLINILNNKVMDLRNGAELIEDMRNVERQLDELESSIRMGTL